MERAYLKKSVIISVTLLIFIVGTISQTCFAFETSQPMNIAHAKEIVENRLSEIGYESNEIQERLACLSDNEIIFLEIGRAHV